MKTLIQFKTITPLLLIPLLLACFALLPSAQAVGPDTDGAIPGSNNGEGIGVLISRTTGVWNSGTGFEALNHLTAGNQNTATGLRALTSDINGGYNTATGVYSLFSNTGGFFNSATGAYSLANNISGTRNTANGYAALYRNTADDNTATGFGALHGNTTGTLNTAVGTEALFHNDSGSDNNAVGAFALNANTSGTFNNAHGHEALFSNVDGGQNNAVGDLAMFANTTGSGNTAVGDDALFNNVDGSGNVAIGDEAGTGLDPSVSNCIAINVPGAGPFAVLDNTCFIGSIFDQPVSDVGTQEAVFVDQFNVVGITASSRRFKHDIQPMDKSSEAILALKPVTFKYNSDINGRTQYGLVAEDVAEVNPDLVVRRNGEISTVRYEQVNAMLLNEFLKEHKKVQNLEVTVAQQQKGMEVLTAQLREQAAQIQKVSTQVEVNKPAPQTVANK